MFINAEFAFMQRELAKILHVLVELKEAGLPGRKPVRIYLGLPLVFDGDKIMNFELTLGKTAFIPINTLDAAGAVVPAPAGDVFSVVSSDPASMTASIDVMPSGPLAGAVALKLVGVAKASGLTATITDTAALTSDIQTVDIVEDLTPKAIGLDLADAVIV